MGDPCRCICNNDGCIGQDGPGGVSDCAEDGPGCGSLTIDCAEHSWSEENGKDAEQTTDFANHRAPPEMVLSAVRPKKWPGLMWVFPGRRQGSLWKVRL